MKIVQKRKIITLAMTLFSLFCRKLNATENDINSVISSSESRQILPSPTNPEPQELALTLNTTNSNAVNLEVVTRGDKQIQPVSIKHPISLNALPANSDEVVINVDLENGREDEAVSINGYLLINTYIFAILSSILFAVVGVLIHVDPFSLGFIGAIFGTIFYRVILFPV